MFHFYQTVAYSSIPYPHISIVDSLLLETPYIKYKNHHLHSIHIPVSKQLLVPNFHGPKLALVPGHADSSILEKEI
jgi:hypothetical protein